MPLITQNDLTTALARVGTAVGANEKGRSLEDLICYLFPLVPGVEIAERNELNAFDTEEVDVAIWNDRDERGFYFLPHILLIECKNWSNACGSQEVAYFASRLQQRGCDHGIFIAANGITGSAGELTRAHFEVATALTRQIRIIILTLNDISALTSTEDMVKLLKRKLCQLAVSGTNFVSHNSSAVIDP